MREVVIPALEAHSGKRAGGEFGVCINPEFLREGTAVHDYFNPPKTVIGEFSPASGDLLASLYEGMPGPLIRTDIETAEMVKYADNAWHALKVGFANEIGNVCKALGVDGQRVMGIFCQDTKLNLSSSYLKPGFAFGGSCLPKDLRALLYKAKTLDVSAPILGAILPSNEQQIERGVRAVIEKGSKNVGIGPLIRTDIETAEMVKYADNAWHALKVGFANEIGNVCKALEVDGHRLMVASIDEVLDHAGTIVIGNAAPEFRDVPKRLTDGQTIIDLVRITDSRSVSGVYEGICW